LFCLKDEQIALVLDRRQNYKARVEKRLKGASGTLQCDCQREKKEEKHLEA
jgi:hypothetical protein